MAREIFMVVIAIMKNPFHATTGLFCDILLRFTGISRLMNVMNGILMAFLFQSTGEVRGQTAQGSYAVKLAWNASVSTDVTGYCIHYGTASGRYASSIVVGNLTSGTVSGLADGDTYYFAISAVNAAGLESGFSNEVSFKPGIHMSLIRVASNGETVLSLRGQVGHQYDIEASEDLNAWTLISTVTIPDGGSLEYSDPAAGSYSRRFYRTRPRP